MVMEVSSQKVALWSSHWISRGPWFVRVLDQINLWFKARPAEWSEAYCLGEHPALRYGQQNGGCWPPCCALKKKEKKEKRKRKRDFLLTGISACRIALHLIEEFSHTELCQQIILFSLWHTEQIELLGLTVSVAQFCSDAHGPLISRPTLNSILKNVLYNGDALHSREIQRPFLLHAPTLTSRSCCPEAVLAGDAAVSLFQPCQAGYPAHGCLCSLRPELHNPWSVECWQCLCLAYAIISVSLWPLIFMLQHSNSFQGVKCISNCAFFTVY